MTVALPAHESGSVNARPKEGIRPPLLFLCHRIPFPPNKGDKIRAFHLLKHLSQHFEIYLASFVDDPQDWQWSVELEKLCSAVFLRPLNTQAATLRSLWGLISREALSIPYYTDFRLRNWVRRCVIDQDIRHALVFSSQMAQFLPDDEHDFRRKVIDFVDVDSEKWEQYSQHKPWPLNWIYAREASALFSLEKELAEKFDAGLFVSRSEADLFKQLSPSTAHKVSFYNNGVDSDYFDPMFEHDSMAANPFSPDELPLVFTGAMDYWPNVEAVLWFARVVFPVLQKVHPNISFTIVGGNPDKSVQLLSNIDGISVTGKVADVRPYLKYARAAIAPMRIARGVQNKVLEAMSMARPVIVSEKGLEGIDATDRLEVLVAESAEDYVVTVNELLDGQHNSVGEMARSCVRRRFCWDDNLPEVVLLLEESENTFRQEYEQ
ncbi:MAG: TIGR03087 family PEP-CTERM/XrtA system glycosyltransferase [Pseudomonadota bacterium]